MVATSHSGFRYSAPLVPWTDTELDKLHAVWLHIQRAAWRLQTTRLGPGAGRPILLLNRMTGIGLPVQPAGGRRLSDRIIMRWPERTLAIKKRLL